MSHENKLYNLFIGSEPVLVKPISDMILLLSIRESYIKTNNDLKIDIRYRKKIVEKDGKFYSVWVNLKKSKKIENRVDFSDFRCYIRNTRCEEHHTEGKPSPLFDILAKKMPDETFGFR